MAEDNRSIHKLYEKDKIGEVQIADEELRLFPRISYSCIPGTVQLSNCCTVAPRKS